MSLEQPRPAPVAVLPVVCDTFHASFDGTLAGWLLSVLSAAQAAKEGVPLAFDASTGELGLYDPESAPVNGWTIRKGNLGVFGGAYTFTAQGRGVWSGVMLAFGEPRAEGADPLTMRRVRVMLGSELLWRHASRGSAAYDAMRGIIDALAIDGVETGANVLTTAPPDDQVKPSRIDLCRDHFGYEWCHADLYAFACRQRNRGSVETYTPEARFWEAAGDLWAYTGAKTATYYIGRRGARARFFRVYDKTEEAAVSGKLPWLEPIWAGFGHQQGWKVWRAEVEHGSEWLAEHGVRTLADVVGFEYAGWRRYTADVRHTIGYRRPNQAGDDMRRCRSSYVWQALSAVDTCMEPSPWKWQTRREASLHVDMAAMAKQAAGCAARLAPLVDVAAAENHPRLAALPAAALSPGEVRQQVVALLAPLIEEAQRKQAEAAINKLTEALIEKSRRHIPKDHDHG